MVKRTHKTVELYHTTSAWRQQQADLEYFNLGAIHRLYHRLALRSRLWRAPHYIGNSISHVYRSQLESEQRTILCLTILAINTDHSTNMDSLRPAYTRWHLFSRTDHHGACRNWVSDWQKTSPG